MLLVLRRPRVLKTSSRENRRRPISFPAVFNWSLEDFMVWFWGTGIPGCQWLAGTMFVMDWGGGPNYVCLWGLFFYRVLTKVGGCSTIRRYLMWQKVPTLLLNSLPVILDVNCQSQTLITIYNFNNYKTMNEKLYYHLTHLSLIFIVSSCQKN